MADSDSFINEVTEEVRRDQLFAVLRRWAWVAVLAVLGIVGAATYVEVTRSQADRDAQAFGDALLATLEQPELADRVAGLAEIDAGTPEAAIILAMLQSGELARAGEPAEAAARLRSAAAAEGLAPRYRDLATLRAEMLDPSDPAEARLVLETLATPGAPYAALAQEQLALLALREGDRDGAVAMLRLIEEGAATPPGLQERAAQLIVALESGAELVDTAPEPPVVETPDTGASAGDDAGVPAESDTVVPADGDTVVPADGDTAVPAEDDAAGPADAPTE